MEFARLNRLFFLGLIPFAILFLAWSASQRRSAVARLGLPTLVERLSDSVSRTRRRWKTVLWFIGLMALIIALARPRWGSEVTVRAQEGVEVMVVLDVSESMLAEDIKPNRLVRAKMTVNDLMDQLGGNDVGLVIFSGAAFVQFPLTADLHTARVFLESADTNSISRAGTELEKALGVALDAFPEAHATSRVILLLTDGEGHTGDPVAMAEEAADQDVVIHAIGFGSPSGEPIPLRDEAGNVVDFKRDAGGETVLSRLDERVLQQVTSTTDGLYYRATAGGEEVGAIVDAIAQLETGEKEGQFETHGVERFTWFVALALVVLGGGTVVGDRAKRDDFA